jgi:hypothetical protein
MPKPLLRNYDSDFDLERHSFSRSPPSDRRHVSAILCRPNIVINYEHCPHSYSFVKKVLTLLFQTF